MNNPQSINSGAGILKDYYEGKPATAAMKEALANRKKKLILEGSVPEQDEYNSKDDDE